MSEHTPKPNPPFPVRLTAVMFAYNEGPHIESVVREAAADLARLCEAFQLVVVDDGSRDETPAVLARLAAEIPQLDVVTHPENRGIGEAVYTGYAQARLDYVCILPADGQVKVAEYAKLLPAVVDGADVVLARYRQRGETDGAHRIVLTEGLRLLVWALLGVGRKIDAAFIFRRALLSEVPLKTRSFFVNVELPIRLIRGNYRVSQVEIELFPRVAGQSKVLRLGRIATVFRDVLLLRYHLWRERLTGR